MRRPGSAGGDRTALVAPADSITVRSWRPLRPHHDPNWGSRIGGLGYWASIWGLRSRRWPGLAGIGIQPWRTETFKSPPTPNWTPRLLIRRVLFGPARERDRGVCRRENRRSRRWTGPSPMLPMQPGLPESLPTTTCATALPPCSRPWRWRPGRSPGLPPAPHPRRVPGVSQTGRQAYPRLPLHVVADNYATHVCPESEVMRM